LAEGLPVVVVVVVRRRKDYSIMPIERKDRIGSPSAEGRIVGSLEHRGYC